jgi:16S rRNA processing protein RimM
MPQSPTDSTSTDKVCVGLVTGARGLKGDVWIQSYTATPADVAAYGPVHDEAFSRSFRLRVIGHGRDRVVAHIEGVDDRTAAEALKGLRLFVARTALPEPGDDEFYYADLIGLRVDLATDAADDAQRPPCPFGRVRSVHDFGGGTVLEIDRGAGGALMVPFTRAVVPVVDLAARRLVVAPPEGLLQPAEGTEGAEA